MIDIQELSLNDKVAHTPGFIVSNMDGEKVMLSIENGKYYSLGEMGSEIWSLIEKSMQINHIIAKLISEYDVKEEECEEDVMTFLNTLLQEKIIEVI